MTVRVRVIPCLDVAEGRVVKGVNFVDLVDAGDPVWQVIVFLLGGGAALASHATKATARAAANTSPAPAAKAPATFSIPRTSRNAWTPCCV